MNSSRKATVGTVDCPIGTGSCAVALPKTVKVKLNGVAYKLAIAKLTPVAPGTTGQIIATVPGASTTSSSASPCASPRRVVATNHGGKIVKTAAATIKR